jgi:hypothetical protein
MAAQRSFEMRNQQTIWLLLIATVLGCSVPVAFAQSGKMGSTKADTKDLPFDAHDIAGVWNPAPFMQPKDEVNPLALNGEPTPLPPFTPWGQEKYEENVKFIKAGDVLDCDPFGTARNFFTPRPFEVIPGKDRMVQHYEYYDNWREIFVDGRGVPDDLDPDYMGYSTGKWDGNTFVVDSVGYNGKQFLTWTGLPLTESMHQTERWQRIDHDTLKIVFTFDDPKAYTKSWNITFFYKLKNWRLDAHPCTLSELKKWDKLGHADKLPGLDYKPTN